MIKKAINYIIEFIKEEYRFIIFMLLLIILLNYPVNYYIIAGGGISDVSSRIEVKDKHKSKGNFNISYVTELKGTIFSYALSYIVPTWERDSTDNYKYTKEESLEDIEFRNDLDLKTANGTATYWAYTLANKKIEEKDSKVYVILIDNKDYKTDLKVQDEILSIDGKTYKTTKEYKEYLQTKNTSDKVEVKVLRDNKEKIITSNVYDYKGIKLLGIGLQTVKEYKTTPKVDIKFNKSESGPSGGLITTLEIYNQLVKKDLTKGHTIAGTGTIEEDGTVGQIGGVEYKILGAEKGGAEYFLVPAGQNYKDAKRYKEKNNLKIKLIKVKTIQDAIEKLEALK